ncbi:MAG: hypothetical protein ACRDDH_11815 [Cetobacterium sp.]|uniref:hypothetical protein n=1 Tax=Cetobacterium sp. TaxID=2071632 RepID=UPI003EE7CA8B
MWKCNDCGSEVREKTISYLYSSREINEDGYGDGEEEEVETKWVGTHGMYCTGCFKDIDDIHQEAKWEDKNGISNSSNN